MLDRLGRTDTHGLDDFGLLRPNTILAHSNFVTGEDMELIGRARAGIAHCPLANVYFSNAVFPLRAALDKGLQVGLGTDISGGASPSILDNCRHAITVSRALEDGVDPALDAGRRGRPASRIDFRTALWLATAGGADALGLPVGRFEPGCDFDAMLVDTRRNDSNLMVWGDADGPEDILQKIIYNAGRDDIRKVWVRGRVVNEK